MIAGSGSVITDVMPLSEIQMLFYGIYEVGKVYEVESVGYVVTTIRHVNFVPLTPVESKFVKQFGNELLGTPIALNWKSVFKAYLQLLLGGFMILSAILCLNSLNISNGSLLATCSALFFMTGKLWKYADFEMATNLASQAGLNIPTRLFIENQYGGITDEEFDSYIADYDAGRPLPEGWESKNNL